MTHDPLCPCASHKQPHIQHLRGVCHYCQCDLIAKVRSGERERLLEDWAAGKVQGDTSSDWILNAVRQKNYEQGQRDMLVKCLAVLDAHHPRCTEPCDLCAEWSVLREELEALEGKQ